jgi:FAD/FMN-containing dehydrogenase
MNKLTRKEFISTALQASAALALSACGQPQTGNNVHTTNVVSAGSPQHAPLDLAVTNDARYNMLRQGFNKRIDKHPKCIAVCGTTADVVAAVKYARKLKLPIAVKSGGHSMEGFSCNDGGMVINLSKMNNIELTASHLLKAQPGCLLISLNEYLFAKGRLLPAGSCGTVALGGLTLGGGYGIFARKYGLTCDHLSEATMVDGNGNIVNTRDAPELLWALKGGGAGNFGIVTEMVYHTVAAPQHLQAHYLKVRNLNPQKATSVLEQWMGLAADLPLSCFSGFVQNGTTLNILVTDCEPEKSGVSRQLSALARYTDTFKSSAVNPLNKMVSNYYGRGGPLYFRNSSAGFYKDFSQIAPFIRDVFERTISNKGMMFQVNTMGGKINDSALASQSAYAHRSFGFLSELQAYWDAPAQEAALAKVSKEVLQTVRANGVRAQYINYCSLEFSEWESAYYGDNYVRLQAVKRKYDPENNIRHPHSVRC